MTRRRGIAWLLVAALLLAGAVSLRWLLQPENLAPAILDLAGDALGLEITAEGVGEYRLRGTPQLVVRQLTAREPGATRPLLLAERVLISVPWSTLRARGRERIAERIELDAPVLDVAALQSWLARRPPSDAPLPTLTRGIGIADGQVLGARWKIDGLHAQVQSLSPGQPLRMHLRGRYAGDGISAPLDLHATLTRPASGAGVGVSGLLALETATWRLPARLTLSAKLQSGTGLVLQHAVLGANARYESGERKLPFALGLAGPLRIEGGAISLTPAALSLRGGEVMPTLDALGSFALDESLRLALEGKLAEWPSAWPALPPPLGQSRSPLPFALGYDGPGDLSGVARLELQRDANRFNGRFRLFEVMAWVEAGAKGSPLPPIAGTVVVPRLVVSGAVLEGVEVQLEDPSLPAPATDP